MALPKIISKVQLTTMPSSLTDTLSSGTARVPSQGHKGSHYSRAPVKMGSPVARVLWRQGEDEEEGERPQADRRADRCPQEEAEEEGGRMSPPVSLYYCFLDMSGYASTCPEWQLNG